MVSCLLIFTYILIYLFLTFFISSFRLSPFPFEIQFIPTYFLTTIRVIGYFRQEFFIVFKFWLVGVVISAVVRQLFSFPSVSNRIESIPFYSYYRRLEWMSMIFAGFFLNGMKNTKNIVSSPHIGLTIFLLFIFLINLLYFFVSIFCTIFIVRYELLFYFKKNFF